MYIIFLHRQAKINVYNNTEFGDSQTSAAADHASQIDVRQ